MKRMLSWGLVLLTAASMFWVYISPALAGVGDMVKSQSGVSTGSTNPWIAAPREGDMARSTSMLRVYAASPAWTGEGDMAQSACPEVQAMNNRSIDMSGLLGASVMNKDHEALGRVIDVSGSPSGGINFLIVSSCLPGMSGRVVAVPYTSYDYAPPRWNSVTLNLTTEEFKNAPSFSADSWPNGAESDWSTKAYRYFENTQYFG